MSISRFMNGDCIVECMEEIRDICAAANTIRARKNIRSRQALQSLSIVSIDGRFSYLAFMPDAVKIIKDECNVKELKIIGGDKFPSFTV